MKRIIYIALALLLVVAFTLPAAATDITVHKDGVYDIGEDGKTFNDLYLNDDIIFEGATNDAYELTIDPDDCAADATITVPCETGTVYTSNDRTTLDCGIASGAATNTCSIGGTASTRFMSLYQSGGTSVTTEPVVTFLLTNVTITLGNLQSAAKAFTIIYWNQ